VPELPDIELYLAALRPRLAGATLETVRLGSPFLLRSVDPPLAAAFGRQVAGLRRVGKRIVFALDGDLFLVLHLMIAGRLKWEPIESGRPVGKGKTALAAFDFDTGSLLLTEAGSKRRTSLHLVRGEEALRAMDPGGLEVLAASEEEFAARLRSESHTLKRALTDPRLFAGIGNAYSDEILHRARMSPFALTGRLEDAEVGRLLAAARAVLEEWRQRLIAETGDAFPRKVTAFREGMAVHGRFGRPCPVCGTAVQRLVYAENEANYCPRCQTGGRVLADRALSTLLKDDWPRTIEELEQRMPARQAGVAARRAQGRSR
jgi:formamidopyrimidine-DNA glycosylase